MAIKLEHHIHLWIMKKQTPKKNSRESFNPKGNFQTEKKMFSQHFIDTVFKFIFNCN